MWSNHDKNHHNYIPAGRVFSTPPASWKSPHSPAAVMPMSERKGSNCVKRDLFHVVHKVPAGDSPYVKAKHVQLIDKDPSKAISLFWAAINAGDRVDSALKDMAVVMKQLDRSDEAVEAIKSFRHLCSYDSQESLDNVLVELYKRSGRIEEEINMLQRKLKNIEEGIAFGGKKTKTARSQGKKVQITVEQEKARILGNLAWAYLQHHDYGLAEQHYRKALSLDPDYNKQCNLALCLMHMNRIPEAKSLLQAVSASCGSKQMDESYAKSFERAVEILNELESRSLSRTIEEDKEDHKSLAVPAIIGCCKESRRWENGENKESVLSDKFNRGSYCENRSENQRNFLEYSSKCISSGVDNDWRKGHYFESPSERCSNMKENRIGSSSAGKDIGSKHKKMLASPGGAVLYTQPRRGSWGLNEGGQGKVRWEDIIKRPSSGNLLAHAIRNLDGDLHESTTDYYKSEAAALSKSQSSLNSPADRNWRGSRLKSYEGCNNGYARNVIQHDSQQASWRRYSRENGDQMESGNGDQTILVDEHGKGGNTPLANVYGTVKSTESASNPGTRTASKSWADMVEEEEQKLKIGEDLSPPPAGWNYEEEEDTDENLDSNVVYQQSPVKTITQNLEAFDLIKDGYDICSDSSFSPRNPTVRRSLCFDGKKDSSLTRKKNRLQVFRDITPTPDSP